MHQSKNQLLRTIRKETKPPNGFGQWIFILECRRLSDSVGLLRLEAHNDKKLEWSGALSVNLPEPKRFSPDGKELVSSVNWDKLTPGQSSFNVLTVETRGKSVLEVAKGFFKRSFESGKLQDVLPWVKGG